MTTEATVFYGLVPLDVEGGASFAYPWRMSTECHPDEALDEAQGIPVERGLEERRRTPLSELRRDRVARPVALLRVGRHVDRYVLAVRDSVTHVDPAEVMRSRPIASAGRAA